MSFDPEEILYDTVFESTPEEPNRDEQTEEADDLYDPWDDQEDPLDRRRDPMRRSL